MKNYFSENLLCYKNKLCVRDICTNAFCSCCCNCCCCAGKNNMLIKPVMEN